MPNIQDNLYMYVMYYNAGKALLPWYIKVVLGGINENMASLEQTAMYGVINTIDPTTVGYYVVKFLFTALKIQEI